MKAAVFHKAKDIHNDAVDDPRIVISRDVICGICEKPMKYINQFTEFNGYFHQVLTTHKNKVLYQR